MGGVLGLVDTYHRAEHEVFQADACLNILDKMRVAFLSLLKGLLAWDQGK